MSCPRCGKKHIKKVGTYRQKLSRRYIQRYLCQICGLNFSSQTTALNKFQHKPFINKPLFLALCSGVSLRRTALNLNVTYSTVYRRFLWLSKLGKVKFSEFQLQQKWAETLYMDEMETIHHTKLKPLTIGLIVDERQRFHGLSVGTLPAKGITARLSRKKYGFREDQSSDMLEDMLSSLNKRFSSKLIVTDGKPSYAGIIQKRFPGAEHIQYPAQKDEKIEMPFLSQQKKKFDPLFAINQRCAKLRSDVKRLVRRSWCTTKKVDNLLGHLMLYACYNNNIEILV